MAIARSIFMHKARTIFFHPLFKLFCIGFLLRIALLFVDYSWDVHNHIAWAKDLWARGSSNFFNNSSSEVYATIYPNYPPLALLFFYIVYPLQIIIFKLVWFLNTAIPLFPSKMVLFVESRAFLAGLFKLPAVFFDLGLAYICYQYVQKIAPKNIALSKVIVSLILFNPAFFFNSALWGQIDVIPLFFVVLSLYFLFFTKRYVKSSACFVFGLLVKPTVLVFLPVYLLVLYQKTTVKHILVSLIIAVAVFWVSFLPFIGLGTNPFIVYANKILATQSLPYVTNGAFNFWMLFTRFEGIKDTLPFLFNLSYRLWGQGIFVGLLLIIIYYLSRNRKEQIGSVNFALALSSLAAFLFLTKMHERYSMLYLPFLILLMVTDKKMILWMIILSILSFLNLYHSWSVPKIVRVSVILDNLMVVVILSSITVGVFFYLFKRYVSFSSLYKK